MTIAEQIIRAKEDLNAVYDAGYEKGIEESCPTFEETGDVIKCFPKGSFTVSAEEDTTVKHCGKNLFNLADCNQKYLAYDEANGLWWELSNANGGTSGYWYGLLGYSTGSSGATSAANLPKLIKVPPKTAITLSIKDFKLTKPDDGSVYEPSSTAAMWGMYFYDATGAKISHTNIEWGKISNGFGRIACITPDSQPCYLDIKKYYREYDMAFSSIQVEFDTRATTHEPYYGETFTIGAGETVNRESYEGMNYLATTDNNTITVSGRANPKELLDYITNELITLGADI